MIDEIIKRVLCMRTFPFDNPNMEMIFSLSDLEQVVAWHDKAGKLDELLDTPNVDWVQACKDMESALGVYENSPEWMKLKQKAEQFRNVASYVDFFRSLMKKHGVETIAELHTLIDGLKKDAGRWGVIKELSGDLEEPESIHEMHEAEVEKNHDRKKRANVAKEVIYEIRRQDNPREGEAKEYNLFAYGGIGIIDWILSGNIDKINCTTARQMIRVEMEKD